MKKLKERVPFVRIPDLFDSFFADDNMVLGRLSQNMTTPAVNVIESADSFKIEFAVPGMEKQDFNITVANGNLTVTCEKEVYEDRKTDDYAVEEFNYNQFSRTFRLPDDVKLDAIAANYENGLLTITVPRNEVVVGKAARMIEVG